MGSVRWDDGRGQTRGDSGSSDASAADDVGGAVADVGTVVEVAGEAGDRVFALAHANHAVPGCTSVTGRNHAADALLVGPVPNLVGGTDDGCCGACCWTGAYVEVVIKGSVGAVY